MIDAEPHRDAILAPHAPWPSQDLELVCRINQVGTKFTTFGYLTEIVGLAPSSLFDGTPRNEHTAHFTLYSETEMKNRSVTGGVHALHVSGPLHVHLKQTPGADFDHPASFRTGKHIGAFDGDFQSIVSVTSPKKAIETLAGSLQQTGATRFTFGGVSHLLGQVGLHLR